MIIRSLAAEHIRRSRGGGVKLSVDLHVKSDSETLTVITNRLQLAR